MNVPTIANLIRRIAALEELIRDCYAYYRLMPDANINDDESLLNCELNLTHYKYMLRELTK